MSAQRPSTTVGTFASPKPTEALSGKKEQTSYSLRSWLLVVLKIWRLDVHLTMAVSVSPRYSRPPSAVQQFCLAILVLGCLSVPNQVLPFLLCEDKFCIVAVVIYHLTVPRVHFPLSFYVTKVFFSFAWGRGCWEGDLSSLFTAQFQQPGMWYRGLANWKDCFWTGFHELGVMFVHTDGMYFDIGDI